MEDVKKQFEDDCEAIPWKCDTVMAKNHCVNFLRKEQWSDCTFEVGSETKEVLKAHKLVLSMCSPVFAAMFHGPMSNSDLSKPIVVPDIEPKIFQSMLEYIYGGEETLSEKNVFDDIVALYYAAKKYLMVNLVDLCSAMLTKVTDSSKACEAYELAKLYNDENLRKVSLNIIECDTEDVLTHPSFLNVTYDTLMEIFDMNLLTMLSERVLHDALVKWMGHYCNQKNVKLTDKHVEEMAVTALNKISFASMTLKELLHTIDQSPFFTFEEKFVLVKMQIDPSMACELSSKVCKSRTEGRGMKEADMSQFQRGRSYSTSPVPKLEKRGIIRIIAETSHAITFVCNCDLVLDSVTVRTQESLNNRRTYREVIEICLKDSFDNVIGQGHLNSSCNYNYSIIIALSQRIHIKKMKVYTITAKYGVTGDYPLMQWPNGHSWGEFQYASIRLRAQCGPESFCFLQNLNFTLNGTINRYDEEDYDS